MVRAIYVGKSKWISQYDASTEKWTKYYRNVPFIVDDAGFAKMKTVLGWDVLGDGERKPEPIVDKPVSSEPAADVKSTKKSESKKTKSTRRKK